MNDALLVRSFERFSDLPRDRQRLLECNPAMRDPIGQRLPASSMTMAGPSAVSSM
jgi:hypothetical protein